MKEKPALQTAPAAASGMPVTYFMNTPVKLGEPYVRPKDLPRPPSQQDRPPVHPQVQAMLDRQPTHPLRRPVGVPVAHALHHAGVIPQFPLQAVAVVPSASSALPAPRVGPLRLTPAKGGPGHGL